MTQRHLFLALTSAAFGELHLGLQIARELHAGGDEVLFVAPSALSLLLRDGLFPHRPVDPILGDLDRALAPLVAQERCHTVTLLDAASVFSSLDELCLDERFLGRLEVPLLALDVWNLGEAGLEWDYGVGTLTLAEMARAIPRRLTPVPIARPAGPPGAYDALPHPVDLTPRAQARSKLGLGAQDRLLLVTTSRWQEPDVQNYNSLKRLARLLPALVLEPLRRLGPRLQVAHVCRVPFPAWSALEGRYHPLPHLEPARFAELLAAADLVLSFNSSATTTTLAAASGVPVVLAINSYEGRTPEEVVTGLPGPPSPALRAWLAEACPLYRFRAWPLGLFRFLAPVLADNPYASTFHTAEVLDAEALFQACHDLLFDAEARERLRACQQAYAHMVRALPSAGQVFRSLQ